MKNFNPPEEVKNTKSMESHDKPDQSNIFTLSKIVFYLFSIVAFFIAIRYVGKFNDISKLILQINPIWLAVAVLSQALTYLTNAMTLFVLLKKTKHITFITLFKISVVIMFVNQALPTGGLSGNGYIFHQLIRRKVPLTDAYHALITQTFCYYTSIVFTLGIFYCDYLLHYSQPNGIVTSIVIIGFLYFAILGTIMIIISNKRVFQYLMHKLNKFRVIRNYLEELKSSAIQNNPSGFIKNLLANKRITISVIFLQMGIILLDIVTICAILKGFHIQLPIWKISLTLILSQVVGAFPISPGSLIAYESAMTYFLNHFGLPVHAALIATLMFRFLTFWLPIPTGLFLYRNLRKYGNDHK